MRARHFRSWWAPLALSGALVALALPGVSAGALSAREVVATGAALPATATILERPITTSFDVSLKVRNRAALDAYVTALTNPTSSDYRHFLSTAQFARRFGASASTVGALRAYLASYGLRVGTLSKGRVVVHVHGSTTNIARAFATSVVTVRRANGTIGAQFDAAATLPRSLASHVAGIGGFSSIIGPSANIVHPHVGHAVSLPTSCLSTTNPNATGPDVANFGGGYNVAQQASLYGLSAQWSDGITGAGQTVAIYELGQYDPADLAAFDACYHLTPSVTKVNVDGGPGSSFSDEATLDVEEEAALAPGANIVVYQGPDGQNGPLDVYQTIADANVASVVTTSWGACELDSSNDPQSETPIFEQMAVQGQTVLAAAGDSGSADCNGDPYVAKANQKRLAVDDPASQPLVTGVGGLTVSNTVGPLESVWNSGTHNSTPGAGGGGASALWSRPVWQSGLGITSADKRRMVPDLSVMGDPGTGFIMYYSGVSSGKCNGTTNCWQPIGGTSIGSPIVSAMVATAAQSCGVTRLGFINPTLYAKRSVAFSDVTSGTNDLFSLGGYSASAGYDMASGLGSPTSALYSALCPTPMSLSASSLSPHTQKAATGTIGATVAAHLVSSANVGLANATLNVTATGASGTVMIDGLTQGSGPAASAVVTTNAAGVANVTVTSSTAQSVSVNVTYLSQSLGTALVTFAPATAPGRASITKLSAIVGGFTLRVKAPASNGGSAITRYQYSTSGGRRWINLPAAATSATIVHLTKGHSYAVVVRAINAVGAGPASPRRVVHTKL